MPPAELLATNRAALEREKDRLSRQLAALGGGTNGSDLDHNFADSGQVAAEVGEARSLAGSLEDQLAAVQEALDRIDDGTYGLCQSCGQPIGEARLEAMPETRWCISCAGRA
ncbi:MAG TPA: TraR/DksA C4-type zinc finger protein [Acidimicrobiales bacterium]|nr:TraR/DksA C4-type zinc finger protein [Acidimicrobiales bacterium]